MLRFEEKFYLQSVLHSCLEIGQQLNSKGNNLALRVIKHTFTSMTLAEWALTTVFSISDMVKIQTEFLW